MNRQLGLLDVVALTEDLPAHNLLRGQVGTVVEILEPGVYEIDFCDDRGHSYASVAVRSDQLMLLRYTPAEAA
jgi:hypothetical protein